MTRVQLWSAGLSLAGLCAAAAAVFAPAGQAESIPARRSCGVFPPAR